MYVCYSKLILTNNGNKVFQDTLRAHHPYLSTKLRSHQSAEPHSRSSTYLIPAMAANGEIATRPLSTPACEQITHPYAPIRASTPQNTPICTQFPKRACERPVILPIRARIAWPLEDPDGQQPARYAKISDLTAVTRARQRIGGSISITACYSR
jgi:hypothetical protein